MISKSVKRVRRAQGDVQKKRLKRLVELWYGDQFHVMDGCFEALAKHLEANIIFVKDEAKRRIFEHYYLGSNYRISVSSASYYVYLHHSRAIMKHALGDLGREKILSFCYQGVGVTNVVQ